MDSDGFKGLLRAVGLLSERQLDQLSIAVDARRSATKSTRVIETARHGKCPTCGAERIVRNGHARGMQRYLCRGCGGTFNTTTGTALNGLHHKARLFSFGQCMAEGLSVRDTAQTLGVAVSTAHRLRHRFLDTLVQHQPKALAGLVELDETYFRESFKGSRKMPRDARNRGSSNRPTKGPSPDLIAVLVARSRGSLFVGDAVLGSMSKDNVVQALRSMVGPDTLLVADGSGTIKSAAAELGVALEALPAHAGRTRGAYHIQTVNQYHERLKTWINRELRGVATANLPKYLAWLRTFEWYRNHPSPEIYLVSALGTQLINT
jgi:transposase-like protein